MSTFCYLLQPHKQVPVISYYKRVTVIRLREYPIRTYKTDEDIKILLRRTVFVRHVPNKPFPFPVITNSD